MTTTANLGITLLEESQSGKATTVNVAFTTIDAAIGASGTTVQAGVTTSTTLTNQNVVLADATAGALTVTLPASPVTGQSVIVKKVDSSAHVVTVAPSSGTIDGAATRSLAAQNQSALLVYTASGWEVGAETAGAAGSVNSVNTRTGAVTLVGTDIPAFVASGGSHAAGAVPDPGSVAGTAKFLCEDATWKAVAGASGGTVTSVQVTVPGLLFVVSGGPITGAGTIAFSLNTQGANTVLAGPTSGGAATPTMRALVAADIPSLTLTKISDAGTLASQSGTFSGTSSGTNTGDQTITLTGDVTGSGTGSFAATIASNAVTNAKAAQMAASTLKGNNTGGTANAADLTVSQVAAMLAGTTSTTLAAGNDSRFTTVAGNNQTASYTLVLADAGKVVEMNVASANTLTIPPVSSVAWPVGTVVEVFQLGAGQTTVTAGAGVTLRSDGGKAKTTAQYATVGLRMRANDEWVLSGDLSA